MSTPVNLNAVIHEVDGLPRGWRALLNTRTGAITILSENEFECINAYDEGDEEEAFRDVDWSEEDMLAAREELHSEHAVELTAHRRHQ